MFIVLAAPQIPKFLHYPVDEQVNRNQRLEVEVPFQKVDSLTVEPVTVLHWLFFLKNTPSQYYRWVSLPRWLVSHSAARVRSLSRPFPGTFFNSLFERSSEWRSWDSFLHSGRRDGPARVRQGNIRFVFVPGSELSLSLNWVSASRLFLIPFSSPHDRYYTKYK